MKKDRRGTIWIVSISIFLLGLLFFGVYFSFAEYNYDCLEFFAKKYCSENNVTFSSGYESYFYCSNQNERFSENKNKFYFLYSEREACLIKDKWSMIRLPKDVQELVVMELYE